MMLWLTVEWVHFDYDLLRVTITPRISNRNICFLVIKAALCTFVKYMETKKKGTHILFGGWILPALMIEDSCVSRINFYSATALIQHVARQNHIQGTSCVGYAHWLFCQNNSSYGAQVDVIM
jgi:hypothetical protein